MKLSLSHYKGRTCTEGEARVLMALIMKGRKVREVKTGTAGSSETLASITLHDITCR